jgi:hypothetical protein
VPLIHGNEEEKLSQGRALFVDWMSKRKKFLHQCEDDFDFAAGRQWDERTLQLMRAEQRPALVFNQIAPAIRELIGAAEDARRRPKPVPVGTEDLLLSEILDRLLLRVSEDTRIEHKDMDALEKALTCGIGYIAMDVEVNRDNLQDIDIKIQQLSSMEVIADPASTQSDLSDARGYFWFKWLSEAEFKHEFPEHAAKYRMIRDMQEHGIDGLGGAQALEEEHARIFRIREADFAAVRDTTFFDRRRDLIRLVHFEYQNPVRRHFAFDQRIDPATEKPIGWQPTNRNAWRIARDLGVEVARTWDKEIRWLEFVGTDVLFDDVQPVPVDGFSIKPMIAYWDHKERVPYGIVRDTRDPQKEINKRYSQEVDWINKQVQPGADVQEDAVDDISTYEKQRRTPGKVAVVKDLDGVRERQIPQVPAAVEVLSERARLNFDRTWGIAIDPLLGARSSNEPVGTALLRHRKSLQAITTIMKNHREFQRTVRIGIIQIIVRMMNDEQIERMLSNRQKFSVTGSVVADAETGEQVSLETMRNLRWNVEMESVADDTTSQLLLLQTVTQLTASGFPMDPDIIADLVPLSRDQKTQLKLFIGQTQQQQQEQQAATVQSEKEQLGGILSVEMNKTIQKEQSDRRRDKRDREGMILDFVSDMSAVLADADDAKKKQFLGLLKVLSDVAEAQIASTDKRLQLAVGQAGNNQQEEA